MPFKPSRKQPHFADLKGILAQSRQTENPLYQTVQEIIERLTQFQEVSAQELHDALYEPGNQGLKFAPRSATYITQNDESANLPNSRQLIAGSGITLDVTVDNQMTISSSGSGGDEWSVLTNGNTTNPELIYAGGDVIMLNW